MSHLGVYYAPEHSFQVDRDYIAALQPPVIRILDPDVQHIADMHALAPNAIVAPRTWAIDDGSDEDHPSKQVNRLMADPIGTGRDHAQQYASQLDRWKSEASQRGLKLPNVDRILFNSANEPNQGGSPDMIAAYCVAFLNRCTELGIRACAPCLGVGWPDNTGPDTPVNWKPYADAGLEQAIRRNGGMLSVHEYFYKTGPQDGWRWLAGRHLQCPFDVPILFGEMGIDNYVDKARWDKEGGNRGWQGNVSPDQYAEMIEAHIRGSDRRLVAGLIFITDFRNNSWESFNTRPAHNALLSRKDRMVPQVAPPIVSPGLQPVPQPVEPVPVPTLAHPIKDPAQRVVSQVFGVNPERYARFGLAGHNGIDFAVPEGTSIYAVDEGMVVEVLDDADGYGLYVKLRHMWGESLYAHLKGQAVNQGNPIAKGDFVGVSGNTGNSTGPHLHFGMRVNPYKRGVPFDGYSDPAPYLADAPTPASTGSIPSLIKKAAAEFELEWQLIAALAWAESSFNPRAESKAGAKGLLQLMQPTWDEWSAKVGGTDIYNPAQNLRVGTAYLAWLIRYYKGDVYKAVLAYNLGSGNVDQGVKPPQATIAYVERVLMGRDLIKALGS